MNKKGLSLRTLLIFIICIVVFFSLFYLIFSPQGIYGITKAAEKIGLSKLPGKLTEEKKEIPEERIPIELKNSYNDLIENLKFWKDKEETNCLIKFKALPNDFEGHIINIHLVENTKDYGISIVKSGQYLLGTTIKDIIPCYTENMISYDVTNININENTLKKIKILGEDYNLLYKTKVYNKKSICFLENCDNDCLQEILINKKTDFCDISYKEVYTDVFYDNIYYGNLDDWKKNTESKFFGGVAWEYNGKDENVANEFKEFGISREKFQEVFSKSIRKIVDGVWYNGYYGKKEDWCYFIKQGFWNKLKFWESKDFFKYIGTEKVIEKEINKDKKNRIFGPVEIEECKMR